MRCVVVAPSSRRPSSIFSSGLVALQHEQADHDADGKPPPTPRAPPELKRIAASTTGAASTANDHREAERVFLGSKRIDHATASAAV